MGCEEVENLCLDAIDSSWLGVAFEVVLFIYSFVGIAAIADAHLTPALETLCERWSLPEDVAGASFLALGSAAPEILINMVSTVKSVLSSSKGGNPLSVQAAYSTTLGISSILGSAVIAFCAIPGLCALVVPVPPMLLTRRPLARDAGAYLIGLLALFWVMADGWITLNEAATLVALYAGYLLVVVVSPWVRQKYKQWRAASLEPRLRPCSPSFTSAASAGAPPAPPAARTW